MLIISGPCTIPHNPAFPHSFNLAIEMLIISGPVPSSAISQKHGFNLAIEMLVISGDAQIAPREIHPCQVSISQSRCLSFQERSASGMRPAFAWFQSRNRDACHFRLNNDILTAVHDAMFQSRNRDACHFREETREGLIEECRGFNLAIEMLVISGKPKPCYTNPPIACFNLAIEMLIISGG